MKKYSKSIEIAADQRTVWETVVDPLKYEAWAGNFGKGSYFEGGWNIGDAIRFLACDDEGRLGGVVSRIAESRYPEFISIQHMGIINNGVEDVNSEMAREWSNFFENYHIDSVEEGRTRFTVDMDIGEAYMDTFEDMWPRALDSIKNISEECYKTPMIITVRALVHRPISEVWSAFTLPEHITGWNYASEDWCCPKAENNPEVGGRFVYTMAAKDGSMSFDFSGTYTEVVSKEQICSTLDDNRSLSVIFKIVPEGVLVEETFTAEGENTLKLQREGWQAILKNFAAYAEAEF